MLALHRVVSATRCVACDGRWQQLFFAAPVDDTMLDTQPIPGMLDTHWIGRTRLVAFEPLSGHDLARVAAVVDRLAGGERLVFTPDLGWCSVGCLATWATAR